MPRLPFDGSPRVTCDHACHERRDPPSGGEDFAMIVGTNLYAPFDATMRFHTAGTGGWTVTFTPTDPRLAGLSVQLMHLSAAVGLSLGESRTVREGEHAAESGGARGAAGAGNSTGPHVHGHGVLQGQRIALTAAIAWAIDQTREEENNMAQGAFFRNEKTGYVYWQEKPNTPLIHISAETWAGYRAQKNEWVTLPAVAVDGLIAKWGLVESPAQAAPGGVSVDLRPVLTAIDDVPAKTRAEIIRD